MDWTRDHAKNLRLPKISIGADVRWFWDVRLWSPFILILFLLLLPGKQEKPPVQVVVETTPAVTIPVETVPETQPQKIFDADADALAKLAESVGAGRSDNVKRVIMWVAINRSEDRSNGYGLGLAEEISRPQQWQSYDETIPYTEDTYDLALEIVRMRDNRELRPLDNGMLWFVLNDDGSVTVRNSFRIDNKSIVRTIQ